MKPIFILAAILIFGVLIAVHELGHFLAAKLCGVKVNEFAIGMGPLLWHRQKGETEYSLRALPIGGYCAMEGEDVDTGSDRALTRQSFWKQAVILAAGSIMNFVTGVVILLVLYSGVVGFATDQVVALAPEFPYQGEEGIMPGDRVWKVDGYRTYLGQDTKLFLSYAGETVDLTVLRNGEKITLNDLPRQTYTKTDGTPYEGFGLTVASSYVEEATFANKLKYTCYTAMDFVQLVWFSLGQLFTGGASMEDLSGPVGIVSTITEVGSQAESARAAWNQIFYFAALLAVNLAVMNLLPIPALDGGRIFFLLVDAAALLLFKRKVPEKYQAAVNTAGFVVLMGFMLLVTFQDVFKLFR